MSMGARRDKDNPLYRDVYRGGGGVTGGHFIMNDGEAAPVYAHNGTARGGTANTITLAADASSLHGDYVGRVITLTGGTGSGQEGTCYGYNGVSKVATMLENWATNPDDTTEYEVAAGHN